ncbi:histidine phosphatase family protein [Aeromicrobium sp.]|uniref:histidine phosphatase family protein n=1 Tax=Aeromicrobium sp. TaxID=1871063 RepID=UPI003D6AE56A
MILWVRHGQSTWNLIDRMQGHELSPPLTDLGRAQSSVAADALVGRGVVRLLSSPAVRAQETAAIIGERLGLDVVTEPLLLEKGLDEEVVDVLARVKCVIDAKHPAHTVAVSHGDAIALAVATLTRTPPELPANGSITPAPGGLP